jgi:hypothetical protein
MKKRIEKRPLLRNTHLPLFLLGAAMALYGLVSAVVWSVASSQAMRGLITAGQQRARLAAYEDTGGLIAGIVFMILFIWCAVLANRGPRAAFIIGALASFAPILAGRADTLLFDKLGLVLPAGSVIAAALSTIVFTLPMLIFFIILACSRRVPRGCRWLAFASIFILLGTAFFPIYVTVLAFLLKPGDPAVGRMLEVSAKVIKLRYLLPGLSLLCLAYLSLRFSRKHQASVLEAGVSEKGDTK